MASNINNTQRETPEMLSELQGLRALAQASFSEIEVENAIEVSQQAASQRDLQRYAKVRRKDQPKTNTSPGPEIKNAKLRSASDVLDRLRHDPALHLAEYRIGYLERFEGLREMAALSWIKETTDEDWIPQHRIKYVKRVKAEGDDEIVWDREARIDKIFGSGIMN